MRTARVTATTALALLIGSTLTPAHAENTLPAPVCQFSHAKVSPSTVIVGISKVKTVKVTATVTNCDNESGAAVEFGGGELRGEISPSDADPTKWSGTLRIDPRELVNESAGKASGIVYFDDLDDSPALGTSLAVKRQSRIDVGDMPSKIKKGKKFYFGAGLDVANWEGPWYDRLEGKKVQLQTHTKGGKYKTIKTITSMRGQNGGSLSSTIRLKKTTWFRWVYAGSGTTSAVTGYAGKVTVK